MVVDFLKENNFGCRSGEEKGEGNGMEYLVDELNEDALDIVGWFSLSAFSIAEDAGPPSADEAEDAEG